MERVKQRLALAKKALATLDVVLSDAALSTVNRDAAILRFQYTLEATWKLYQLQNYLPYCCQQLIKNIGNCCLLKAYARASLYFLLG